MGTAWGIAAAGRRTRTRLAAALALLLTLTVLVAGHGSLTPAAAAPLAAPAASPLEAPVARNEPNPAYVVKPGITFNHPFRNGQRGKIHRKIVKTLKNVPAGGQVRVITWNFDSPYLAHKFIAAHERGVSVQIIMSRGLARSQGGNLARSYPMMLRAFARGNKDRPPELRSWIRTCKQTCRGKRGSMHSKLMLVNRSGATNWIVMQGSGNFTGAAAVQQFNDWTTVTENQALYDGWMQMWDQATQDRNFPAMRFTTGNVTTMFAPHKREIDPALSVLNKVQCAGATNTASGRTKVRIANAVWGEARGARIARKARELDRAGCDVEIVFMMMQRHIRGILKGMRAKQMVYITGLTANKFKDRYVHMKGLAVQGNVDGRPDGNVVLSSSENWTQLGWHSDEENIIIRGDAAMTQKYVDHVDLIYREAPRKLSNYVNSADPDPDPRPDSYVDQGYLGPKDYPFHELEAELD
ncbi:phosphatidylserine/phosphatidylglycerophosphate/cardiolipin synthase family protein [Nocardioides sp. SLBN-35]|uniref:phospholipase D-like domain-containing protein n=1 Tax=Nocardioides sp. SLBN-35 TaxID=2768445 RepID=UPI00114D52E4|nr:phospholipase D-like domain-containing protein [Nocardioides sp. SLBN-35]TQK72870.1 phosphatidylserine/phosphatidylglycerophosphate/cardiolipin synthase-like enzyme [Nocardioides sp. SLBN-35]